MTSRPADPPVSPRRARAVPVRLLLALTLCGLASGLALSLAGQPRLAVLAWTACVLPVLAALLVEIARSLRRGEVGLDIVAALSMSAALLIGETLAAAVVALMYAGGSALESFAEGRARREMHALLSRVPRTATRVRGEALEEVPLAEIRPGDLLLIRQGDIVPVDGTLESEQALLDPSALTGESLPVRLESGQEMMSGAANAGELFTLRARREAADSTYAGIVRLVEAAQRDKAPMSRLADRYALVFLAVTLLMAMAAWGFSGDPVRAVAVLVVATPCPLILAVPVALVAGLSRAAHYGVLIKGGRALETLARARTLILDKTGTLTDGRPQLIAVHPCGAMSPAALLASAAALEQASKHPMARALVAAAQAGGAVLPVPDQVVETPGEGIAGLIDGQRVVVGEAAFVRAHCPASTTPQAAREAGQAVVALAIEGELMGTFVLADALRPGIPGLLADLRRAGLNRLLLATGDRRAVAESVTAGLPLDAIHAGLTPAAKVEVVRAERRNGPVAMVGDGVNDAPALAAADLGIAMGARGAAASAEAADIVLLVDRLDPLLAGLDIAQGARRIALQSVVAGIGLSVAGMVAAACGWLTPVEGALLQEAIDVAVILNALRTLRLSPRRAANP